ncbi:MAG: hypothetical protein NT151_11785 [Acidobacteria bacterium]|nr:hypothetical protein [Acidobacteriota bacterium]
MTTSLRRTSYLLIGLLVMVAMSSAAYAQDVKSVALAKELGQLLDAKKLSAIAARDTTEPDFYVAAMYFTGSQLLVVGAKYLPAVLLDGKLLKREYQDVYIDLNSAAKAGTKVFVEDAGADGLKPDHENNKAPDSLDQGGKQTRFDEDWKKEQKLSDADYQKLFTDADKLYCRLLTALIAEARK